MSNISNLVLEKDKDSWDAKLGNVYSGMFYYILGGELNLLGGTDNTQILGNCPSIESIVVAPFIKPDDFTNFIITKIPYDTERFGSTNDTKLTGLTDTPSVFRIKPMNYKCYVDKKLYSFRTYQDSYDASSKRWQNESKLLNYPYSYAMVNDYFSEPFVIKYHCLGSKTENDINVTFTLSNKCTFKLYCRNYKGDNVGNTECNVSNASLELPVSSSAYSQFLATSKATFVNGTHNSVVNELSSGVSNGLNNLLKGNIIGGLTSGIQTGIGVAQTISGAMAKTSDLMSTPRSVKSMGADTIFSLANSKNKIELIRYRITEHYLNRLADYFSMFGYKQNKMMSVNTKNRYYYNYIKCFQANVKGDRIPKDDLQKLKSIYENGTTIWHMDRKGVEVFNYSNDNREV